MSCDLCGKTSSEELIKLRGSYQVPGVADVCGDCRKRCDDKLWEIRKVIPRLMRRWLRREYAKRSGQPVAVSWYKHLQQTCCKLTPFLSP